MRLQDRRPSDAAIENIGIEVRSVRPGYGAQVRNDADLREVGWVTQRLEDSLETEMGREIYHALNAVLEPKVQAIIAEGFYANNVHQHDLLQQRNPALKVRLRLAKVTYRRTIITMNSLAVTIRTSP